MKLPLIAACLAAGSMWSFATADVVTSTNNPKVAQRSYSGARTPSTPKTAHKNVIPSPEFPEPAPQQAQQQSQQQRRTSAHQSAMSGLTGGSTSSTGGGTLALGGNDDCATPDLIAGNGTFNWDNTVATTGVEGQTCVIGTGTGVANDIWFQWNAPYSGTANVSMCAQTTVNTKLTTYDGAGCPLGTFNGCSDNTCAPTGPSVVNIAVVAGQDYMIQIGCSTQTGTWPTGTGTITFYVPPPIPPPANDDCTASTAISGVGSFPFDNGGATVTAGLPSTICGQPWSADIWYDWTAGFTGAVKFETCNMIPAMDTMIAAYTGSGCPGLTAPIACNDDGCGPAGPSQCQFACTAGQHYMLQIMMWGSQVGSTTGQFDLTNLNQAPANDDCAAAATLVGLGAFPYDTTAATTGTQGQNEAICNLGGAIGIDHDVWFQWTAPISGCTKMNNCGAGGGFADSKMAVYATSGCPVSGTAIACNDDSCGAQSTVDFTAVGGQSYMIQLGAYPGAFGASGTLNINQVPTGTGNDECSSPTVLGPASGVFAYDNSIASTGCEGQTESLCAAQGGGSTMENDIWYDWTAPSSGYGEMTTCGQSTDDTRLAAYSGSGCPTPGSCMACRDDSCTGALQSTIIFGPIIAGNHYMLQLADYPGALGGTGAFSLNVIQAPAACDPWDDGTTEVGWGYFGPNDLVWMSRFGSAGVTSEIDSVDIAYPSTSLPNGTPTDIFIWQDGLSQDGDPSDSTLLLTIPTTIQNGGTTIFNNTVLATPLSITGKFFVGTHATDPVGVVTGQPGGYNLGLDLTTHDWLGVSWVAVATGVGATVNYANLGAAGVATVETNFAGALGQGQVLVRANCTYGPAIYTCTPGDPGINNCPCTNPPTGGNRGCNNKGATGGASITASGSNSLATPTLSFTTAGENATVGSVLIQGTAFNAGLTFGHGVRCAAGVIKRLYVKIAVGGSITAPSGLDLDIPAKSASLGNTILAGQLRVYQVYYRDTTVLLPGCPIPANQYNVSNAAMVTWLP